MRRPWRAQVGGPGSGMLDGREASCDPYVTLIALLCRSDARTTRLQQAPAPSSKTTRMRTRTPMPMPMPMPTQMQTQMPTLTIPAPSMIPEHPRTPVLPTDQELRRGCVRSDGPCGHGGHRFRGELVEDDAPRPHPSGSRTTTTCSLSMCGGTTRKQTMWPSSPG